jgi:LmbE family N-acetylglucosaminyl deacetylase
MVIMTNGEKGNHTLNREECFSSLIKLGISNENIFFGNFSDGSLQDTQQTVNLIEEYISRLNIKRVYTHAPNDRHQDHRSCSRAVSSAARKVPEILLFQGPSTQMPFEPHYFITLSERHINKKIESLHSYQTQIQKGIVNLEWIKSLAVTNGFSQNKNYAEAFEINHFLKEEDDI